MNNRTIGLILAGFVFAILQALFFMWTDAESRTAVAWISYGFINAAFIWFVATMFIPMRGEGTHTLTMPYVAGSYLTIELIVGILLMILTNSVLIAVTVQLILLAIYVVRFGIHGMANRATADAVETQQRDIRYIKDSAADVQLVMNLVDDPTARKELQRLYDVIWCGPVGGAAMDDRLQHVFDMKMQEITDAANASDWTNVVIATKQLKTMFEQRRR